MPISGDIGLNYGLCISSVCSEDEVASLVSNSKSIFKIFKTIENYTPAKNTTHRIIKDDFKFSTVGVRIKNFKCFL